MEQGILFVDDEENILNALGRELRPWFGEKGLTWFQAKSGTEALKFLEASHSQVLVLVSDLKMPGMAGDELVSRVKATWPDIESVLISGHAEMQGLSRAVAAGIRGFVPKPWETATLTNELEKALEERERHRVENAEHHLMTWQLSRTQDMQRNLFRNDPLDPDRFHLDLSYLPLDGHFCGGDFYEVVNLSQDRCVVLLGDVSGSGSEAAFVTGVMHTLITQDEIFNLLAGSASPGYLLKRLNSLVFATLSTDKSRTIALTVLLFDYSEGTLKASNAGGLPLLRIRNGEGTALHLQGFPLGLTDEADYQVLNLRTQPGDRWVLMTDGMVDRGPDGLLGGPEVVELVTEGLKGGGGHEAVLKAVRGRFPEGKFLNDLTLMTLEVI